MARVEGETTQGAPEKKSGGFAKLLIISLVLIVAVSGGVTAALFITGAVGGTADARAAADAAEPKEKPPLYLSLDPPLVVNFQHQGRVSYLQVGIDVMSRDQAVLDQVKNSMPVVRNNLILLFSNQQFDTLNSREGKEKLRQEALQAVRTIVAGATGSDASGVEQIYFTSFVMQ